MGNKILILIFILAFSVLFSLLTLKTSRPLPAPYHPTTAILTPTPLSVILSFLPQTISTYANQNYQVLIKSSTLRILPDLVQLELSYEPRLINLVSLNPSPDLAHFAVILNEVDPINGRVSYVLQNSSNKKLPTNPTALALLNFHVASTADQQDTAIKFMPKTTILDQSANPLPIQTSNLNIMINPSQNY